MYGDEEDFSMAAAVDPIVGRGQLLGYLAKTLNEITDKKVREILITYMIKAEKSIQLPPQGELVGIDGGKPH